MPVAIIRGLAAFPAPVFRLHRRRRRRQLRILRTTEPLRFFWRQGPVFWPPPCADSPTTPICTGHLLVTLNHFSVWKLLNRDRFHKSVNLLTYLKLLFPCNLSFNFNCSTLLIDSYLFSVPVEPAAAPVPVIEQESVLDLSASANRLPSQR